MNFRYDLEEEQWSVTSIPNTTEEGNKLLIKTGNKMEPILGEEWGEMEQACKMRSHHLDTSLTDPDSLDKWSDELKNLYKITRPRLKNHPTAIIAKRMMGTQIHDIPEATQKNGRWLLPITHYSVAWMACAKILGIKKESKPETCFEGQKYGITEKGKAMMDEERGIKGFKKDEILQEGDEGVHDFCQSAMREQGSLKNVELWLHFLQQLWDKLDKSEQEEKRLTIVKKLAYTLPENMPGWNGKLPSNPTNLAWVAAQKLLGSVWRRKKQIQQEKGLGKETEKQITDREQAASKKIYTQSNMPASNPNRNLKQDLLAEAPTNKITSSKVDASALKTPPSIIKKGKFTNLKSKTMEKERNKVGFTEKIESGQKQPTNPYLKNLNKANKRTTQNFVKQQKAGRKTKKGPDKKTLLKLRVPIQIDSIKDWNDAIQDTVEYLKTIWKALLRVDPQNTSIEGWKDPKDNRKCPKAITNESQIPLSKTKIEEKYVEKMRLSWSSSKQDTELRMILGHKKSIGYYMDNEELNNRLMGIKAEILVDRVQAEKTATAGYLAGPVVTEATAFNLAAIILENKVCMANGVTQMDIREEQINIRQEKSKFRAKKIMRKPKAMHVIVPYQDKAQARACLSKLFPSKVRGDYPLGIQFRFVPNTADTDFSVSPKARTIASRLSNKQAGFLAANVERENNHIRNIYANLRATPNVTMLGVMMALRSRSHPDRQLFTCIQQEYEEGPVTFQYLTQFEQEADAIIPVLPLFLEGVLGPEAKRWFKPSAEMGTEGYKFDSKLNRVVPSSSNLLIDLDQGWDQEVDQWNSEESLSDLDSDDDLEGFAIEFGKIDFDSDLRVSNLGDDSESLGTMGLPSPKGFVVPQTNEENESEVREKEEYNDKQHLTQEENEYDMEQTWESGSESSDTSMENVEDQVTAPLKQGEGGYTS